MICIIKRYIDIALYSVISWLLISYIGQSEFAKKTIEGWREFSDSLPYPVDYLTYFIAGLLTKHILVNCGDYSFHHELHNEKRFLIKSEKELSHLGWFNLKNKLYLLIANPPLRLSIIFYCGLIIATSSPEVNGKYITPILFYILGIFIPQTIKSFFSSTPKITSTIEETQEQYPDKWYQYERPIRDVNEDFLGRAALVKRLHSIITSDDITDARGIAIVGGYGMGKTSLINMALNKVMLSSHNFVICHITTWGNYTSEENIQQIIIEQIISEVTKITSTTSLSGLPSKYINSLKGAQSLWLDALPLLDCHSSPNTQLDKLHELLSRINHKVILVIEDIDRNDEKIKILNSIASLIDRLNSYSSFRLILSIGEELYQPAIINRVCRYKENITFDNSFKVDAVENSIKVLLSKSELTYKSSEDLLYTEQNQEFKKFIEIILSYITNIRDLKAILRELEYDWNHILCGSCDIVDLLAFTILKQFEPSLIGYISENNSNLIAEAINKMASQNESIKNKKNTEAIINYLFNYETTKNKSSRLQSCILHPSKYIPVLIEKIPRIEKNKIVDQEFFSVINEINRFSETTYDIVNSIEVERLLSKATELTTSFYITNAWGWLFRNCSLLIMLYQLQYGISTRKKSLSILVNQAAGLSNKFNLFESQDNTCNEVIGDIVQNLLSEGDIDNLKEIYQYLFNPPNKELIYRPSTDKMIDFFELKYNKIKSTEPNETPNAILEAMYTMYVICNTKVDRKDSNAAFIEPFKKRKSEFITEFLKRIKTFSSLYQSDSLSDDKAKVSNWYQNLLDQKQ